MKGNRSQQILDATRKVLVKEGLKAVTMRRVAREVGVSAPSIYRHFKDRDALIRAVMGEGSRLFAAYLFRALDSSTPRDQLAVTGMQYIRFALDQEVLFGLMFAAWNELSIPRHSPHPGPGAPAPGLQFLMDRVAACLSERKSRQGLMEAALEQWAVAHGLATLYLYAGGRQMMTRERFEGMCERIVRRAAWKLGSEQKDAGHGTGMEERHEE